MDYRDIIKNEKRDKLSKKIMKQTIKNTSEERISEYIIRLLIVILLFGLIVLYSIGLNNSAIIIMWRF